MTRWTNTARAPATAIRWKKILKRKKKRKKKPAWAIPYHLANPPCRVRLPPVPAEAAEAAGLPRNPQRKRRRPRRKAQEPEADGVPQNVEAGVAPRRRGLKEAAPAGGRRKPLRRRADAAASPSNNPDHRSRGWHRGFFSYLFNAST